MYLFFDTETTGLPRNYNAPISEVTNWPRMVQIAWILQDNDGNTVVNECYIIKPKGFTIPVDASRMHGITTLRAEQEGVDLPEILHRFNEHLDASKYLIAHNISFDEKIVGAEYYRHKISHNINKKSRICTMHGSTNYCAINGNYGYKRPKLIELHRKLFNCGFDGAHDANADITATAKCFWELKRRGII